MKKRSNIYLILTYLFFIYPPFIWGLVLIYQEGNYGREHITSLIINLILILFIALVCGLLIYKEKIHVPSDKEIKHLLFGLIGNVVVYFYTFQNVMKIDDIVTIYLVLLIVLGVHTLLISKKLLAKELWILMPIFLVLDYWHLIGTGCGYTDSWNCYDNAGGAYLYVIYSTVILVSVGYYAYRVYLLNQWTILRYINLFLITFMSILFQNEDWMDEKLAMTIAIMLPFFTIVDFIVSIVNKKYTHKMLIHYIRMYTILMVLSIIGAMGFFYGDADNEVLVLMVVVTYISLFIVIASYLLKIDSVKVKSISKDIIFGICNESHVNLIKSQFSEAKGTNVSLALEDYSLVAMKGDTVVAFMCTITKTLPSPLENLKEASVEIIEVSQEYQKQGIATKLIQKTEKHFASEGIRQIRAWTTKDNINYINLWNKLGYCIAPSIIHFEEKEEYLDGYHFIKKI